MKTNRRALIESMAAACCSLIVATLTEAALIRVFQPSEWQLAWLSDVVLAVALGGAVYLWRNLQMTQQELVERDRAELVLQTQLSLAAEIQQRLLPSVPPPSEGIELAAELRSAGKIGGDFYDFVETRPGVWIVLVADVSGKGIPAAMALGSLRSAFRALARNGGSPAALMTQLSESIHQEWLGTPYVTCIVGLFDLPAGVLSYTNAGHPPGILARSSTTQLLTRGGPPAGLLPNVRYDEGRVVLQPGDVCVLVSDGVTESIDGSVGFERDFAALSAPARSASATQICETVMAWARAGHGPQGIEQWDDDRTVVVARLRSLGSDRARRSRSLARSTRVLEEA